ncbi:MAG TPA: ATP-dependent Clp protease ATP-binding subunit, partial [Candidatus Saccharimonas sp.]|nr:ATP-dependent Clp protease ATP-binding subunit [Candidatus Saccharimonas sp.]
AVTKKDIDELSDLHEQNRDAAMTDLKRMMRPELINRMDNIVVFNALTRQDVKTILDIELGKLAKRLAARRMGIRVNAAAKAILLEKGYDAQNGVRPLRRVIQDTIEDEIAAGLLAERYNKGDVIEVAAKKGALDFRLKAE